MSDAPTFARIDPGSNGNNNESNGNFIDGMNFDGNVEDDANNLTNTQAEGWRERERRQRSVRSFMMFILMMMLMDGEEQSQQRHQRQKHKSGGLRGGGNSHNRNVTDINSVETDIELYRARRTQDRSIEGIVLNGNHSRINRLVQRNDGIDFDREIRGWAQEQRSIQTRLFYEKILKDLVLEQPDGSYVKVLVASASNNEAITVADDPSKILLDAATTTNNQNRNTSKPADTLKDVVKKFDEFEDAEQEVWHYPWNATGYYRGDWNSVHTMKPSSSQDNKLGKASSLTPIAVSPNMSQNIIELSPVEAETPLLEHLQNQSDPSIGVHILPPGMELIHSTNRTVIRSDVRQETTVKEVSRRTTSDSIDNTNYNLDVSAFSLRGAPTTKASPSSLPAKLSLTRSSGKVAFQLYSKAVPAMKELSLIDGYIKLCDSNTVGYSTRKDILLRVHGVLVHSLGRLSLVANPRSTGRTALLINDVIGTPLDSKSEQYKDKETATGPASKSEDGRRRLQELLSLTTDKEKKSVDDRQIEEIRIIAETLFGTAANGGSDLSSSTRMTSMADEASTLDHGLHKKYVLSQRLPEEEDSSTGGSTLVMEKPEERRRLDKLISVEDSTTNIVGKEDVDVQPAVSRKKNIINSNISDKKDNLFYSKRVIPFPFAWDDQEQSLQRSRALGSVRSMSAQEKSLEINAGSCEFEINLDVQEEKWTVGQWRKLMSKQTQHELTDASLTAKLEEIHTTTAFDEERIRDDLHRKRPGSSFAKAQKRPITEQAWVMVFNGTIVSPNCNFEARINSTAIRTDWETTTGKAINYSFYMMTICLTQIVLLLRQLLHTQSQSASARVSLLCIGWQTVIDALLCLVHIYLSLAMQPLFTAFASVAFFKLLIFCVIEMKYMAIIIQARNASNGGNSIELLRRQIALLHLRFYVALMGSCLGFFYSNSYRTLYILLLYSFWVPQIIHNVVTEAKKPMHPYYIYGMSLTRLVAPIYMFANQESFLKEVYPESPINGFMCQLLILWVGLQTGVLYAQSRFGARFFIPAQFLPPKYDYHRPIPASILPPGDEKVNPSDQLKKEREFPKTEVRSLVVPNRELSSRGGGARNRKEGKRVKGETVMTAETVTEVPNSSGAPCIECVICYNSIDTSNRMGYMIAPCNHVFHQDCLVQWMEVKMECPVCRHDLPAP